MNTYNQHIRIEEDGSQELYPFDYLEFYESNIHPYEDFKLGNESKRIYEGITASEFRKKHKAGFLNVMQEVLNDKRLEKLQEELETEEKQVCMFNLYILAMFLVERCKTRYVFLLKPTIQETLSALNNVSKITFTNRDGSIAESTSDILIQTLLDALEANKECDTDTCQVEKVVAWDKTLHDTTVIDINHTAEYEEMTLKQTAEHTRAYIKIQDGCNQFCSYCVIPYARGRVRSRRAEDIIREITGMAQNGYREIVLTGIHISSYGIDFDEEAWKRGESVSVLKEDEERRDYSGSSKLIDLLERIHDIEGIERIRIGSLEPRIITEETAARMAALPKLCPHFHLSLQSGCDATLRRMNRKYTSEEYAESVALLRKVFDHPAITTDVIVGFPGETEEEFAQTKEFLDRIQFFEMHIFKYSKRAGTRAAVMSHQVPDPVKTTRSAELLAMEKEQSKQFRTHYVGREAEVLLEETKEIGGMEYLLGHTRDYVKLAVSVKENKKNVANTVICGRVQGFLTDEILLLSPLEFSK